jgi:glucose-6-phosphate 1-dehydrogenase
MPGPKTGPAPVDVLVIFGITGDLARVMTFHSLYRLDKRGLLDCPIVGVAMDHWNVDDLRKKVSQGRIMQPLLDKPPAIHPYAPGTWGPEAADKLTADVGGWRVPWVVGS